MRIAEQWKAYVGPKDERIELEMNRIYKIGFIMLTAGIVATLYYSLMLGQVSFVFEMQTTGSGMMSFSFPEVFIYSWTLLVCLVCAILECRKGFVDNGRFAETDTFPSGYFALLSGITALGVGLLALVLRTLATIQVFGYATLWLESAITAISLAIMLFVLTYGSFYLFFRAAKRRRVRQEAALEDN